jgi:hypothetical protein
VGLNFRVQFGVALAQAAGRTSIEFGKAGTP